MNFCIHGASIFMNGVFKKNSLLIKDGLIAEIFQGEPTRKGVINYYFNNYFVFPGLIDVHVHLREPGFLYKESMKTGTLAAARGGFTSVCAMPNLDPVPDCLENLEKQLEIIRSDARVRVYPYGSITVGERQSALSDFDGLADKVIAFSDDGVGVESADMMRSAMKKANSLGKIITAHCEERSLVGGGYVHDGEYARRHGHRGNPSESEWRQLERDLALVEETGCAYHVCHVSSKESVELIRRAKERGLPVTCETAPHYLLLCDEDLRDEGRFRMNPPIRAFGDRAALVEGIKDGTIDMIATDHAPHAFGEKSGGLSGSLNGITGLETAFPALYTGLVKTGIISLEKLITLMQANPSKRFGIGSGIELGATADFTVFDLDSGFTIDSEAFLSKGRATPFDGWNVCGKCMLTLVGGVPVYADRKIFSGNEVLYE